MRIKHFIMSLLLVALLAISVSASPAPFSKALTSTETITITQLEINDVRMDDTRTKNVEKTDEFEIIIAYEITSISETVDEIDDVQFTVELTGYDKKDAYKLRDTSKTEDINIGEEYDERLNIELPVRMTTDKTYSLKLTVDTRDDRATFSFPLKLESPDELVQIRDVVLSPAYGVQAGRALLVQVRVANRGDSDEDDVKVTFSIPDLQVSDTDYIDELEADGSDDDERSTKDLFLRIPMDAEAGTYQGIVEVEYDDGDALQTETVDIKVVSAPGASVPTEGKTVIAITSEGQNLAAGGNSVVFPITITNVGMDAKTYSVSVTGGDWGTFMVKPSNVATIEGDETKTMFVSVAAQAGTAGEQVFGVSISSNGKTIKELTMKANVVGGQQFDLKRALEVGLIVLVVILVILGLVIGFNKLKEDDKEEGDSYY